MAARCVPESFSNAACIRPLSSLPEGNAGQDIYHLASFKVVCRTKCTVPEFYDAQSRSQKATFKREKYHHHTRCSSGCAADPDSTAQACWLLKRGFGDNWGQNSFGCLRIRDSLGGYPQSRRLHHIEHRSDSDAVEFAATVFFTNEIQYFCQIDVQVQIGQPCLASFKMSLFVSSRLAVVGGGTVFAEEMFVE
jgi:hypothetical protein